MSARAITTVRAGDIGIAMVAAAGTVVAGTAAAAIIGVDPAVADPVGNLSRTGFVTSIIDL
jgi:hypothetical protein